MSGYLEGVLVLLAINVILAYAAFLPIVAGQLNLGVAGFMATGAYLSAYLTNAHGWPPLPAVLLATLLTAGLGLVVAFPILRTRGIYLALATFAFGQVAVAIILNLDVVGGASGYPIRAYIGFPAIAAAAVLVFAAIYCLFHTRFGISVTAVSDDELVADQMGLSVRGLQAAAFTIGSAVAGLAGALHAHHFSYIEAQYFNVLLSIYIVLYVLLGGTQTIYGPLLGAAVFTLLPEVLRGAAQWRYVIFAGLILALMTWRPQGVVTRSLLRRLFEWRRSPVEVT
ncbi:MAG: branched-chain amino acid ABC transporter permease [Burkholderiales bacterium]